MLQMRWSLLVLEKNYGVCRTSQENRDPGVRADASQGSSLQRGHLLLPSRHCLGSGSSPPRCGGRLLRPEPEGICCPLSEGHLRRPGPCSEQTLSCGVLEGFGGFYRGQQAGPWGIWGSLPTGEVLETTVRALNLKGSNELSLSHVVMDVARAGDREKGGCFSPLSFHTFLRPDKGRPWPAPSHPPGTPQLGESGWVFGPEWIFT